MDHGNSGEDEIGIVIGIACSVCIAFVCVCFYYYACAPNVNQAYDVGSVPSAYAGHDDDVAMDAITSEIYGSYIIPSARDFSARGSLTSDFTWYRHLGGYRSWDERRDETATR